MKTRTAARSLPAPEFAVSGWLNAHGPTSLAALRGRVVAVVAFQMLCMACVAHGIPQAKKLAASFASDELEVLGLHTVFEHHEAMGRAALEAFVHEYRIDFPVGIDRAADSGAVPLTMAAYGMRGTPTLLLFDREGRLRHHLFGAIDDMRVGALVARLLSEAPGDAGCEDGMCRLPNH